MPSTVELATTARVTSHAAHLDMLRGLAAVAVMISHLRGYIFADFFTVVNPGVVAKMFYGATGVGPEAVIAFFALSGYLVGGQALGRMLQKRWQWRSYLLRRITRLWIVVVPALLITCGLDLLGQALNGGAGYDGSFRSLYPSSSFFSVRPDYSLCTLLGNLFFLQTIYVPVYGTNGPLWSLAYEFWYYIAIPLVASLVLVPGTLRLKAMISLVVLLILAILPGVIVLMGSIWIAGAVAHLAADIPRVAAILRHRVVAAAVLGFACIAVVFGKISGGQYGKLGLGFAVAFSLPVIAQLPTAGKLYTRVGGWLAKISYTLYLVHFPFLTFIVLVGIGPYRRQLGVAGFVIFVAVGIVTVVWSTAIWWCFERHTDRVFGYLHKRISRDSINGSSSS